MPGIFSQSKDIPATSIAHPPDKDCAHTLLFLELSTATRYSDAMSQVKFEQREDIRVTNTGSSNMNGMPRGRGMPPPPAALPTKEGFMHEVGDALTKGAGPNGYLAVSLLMRQRSGL